MMEKFWGTITILSDYVSAIAPHGVVGGIVLVCGFVILAVGIDRVRAKIDGLAHDVNGLSRKVDSLTLAMEGRPGDAHSDVKSPTVEACDSEASLEEIRNRLEALAARTDLKIDAERR
jgi:outer membrane murein-binding lipoprotein Lpp